MTTLEPSIVTQDEWRTIYAIPVTLRQIEAAGIPLDSSFGVDETEHVALLDDTAILRLTFGVDMDESYEVGQIFGVECLDYRIGDTEASWKDALPIFNRHNAGYKNDIEEVRARRSVRELVYTVAGERNIDDLLSLAAIPFEDWAAEMETEYGDE